MASGDDALAVLRDISTKLDTLIAMAARAGHGPSTPAARPPFARNGPPRATGQQRGSERPIPREASDKDLDSEYGDPEVRAKSPRDWTGPSMQGRRFSECPAEYLDLVAERLDYFASQNEAAGDDESMKKARYNRLDASRGRGWARRIRAGHKPHDPRFSDDSSSFAEDNDIPFAWLLPLVLPLAGLLGAATMG